MQLKDIKDEKDLIPFGEDFFDRSAKSKRRVEQQWLLNIAFVAGDQLVKVNSHTGNLDRTNTDYDPDWVIRIVDNRVLPIHRTMVAKLTKNTPLPSAKAHSREEADIQAARAAVKLLENHWGTLNLDEIHPEMIGWLSTTGNVFYKQFWNPKKGDRIIDLEHMDTAAGLTPDGLPQMKPGQKSPIDFNLGDTDLVLRSPFNVYPEPGKTKLRDMRIFGDAEIMDVEEVERIYGKKVEPEKDAKYVKIQNALSQTIQSGTVVETQSDNSVTVKELYILPCTQFPKGLKYAWAKQTLLHVEEGCEELGFVHFGLIEIPGRFWYKGVIDDVIPLQRRWNHLLSKIEMHNDYYNDPPTIVDPAIIDIEQWTTEPGNLLEAKMSGANLSQATHVVQVPQLDPSVFEELKILDQQFEIVPVMNKVSFGKDTPNARSGIAINFLQEKDDDVIRPLIDQIEASYAQVFKRDFELCQENYEEDRGFAIVGDDNKVEWIEFKKADLEANIDVGVEPGSAMPRSKVAQQAMVMDMLKAGFFTNPQTGQPDYAKALKYMEFGSVDDIYQDNALDSNQAQRENEKTKDGIPTEPEDWHNHDAHIYEHNRVRKTADYENDQVWSPEARQMMADHIQKHMQFIQPPAPPAPKVAESISFKDLPPEGQAQMAAQAGIQLQPPQQPQMGPQPGPGPQSNEPDPQEVMAFLQDLQQNEPQVFAELMSLPDNEKPQAIMQAMNAHANTLPQA